MRKFIIAILLFAAWPAWAATQYLRPTADADTTTGPCAADNVYVASGSGSLTYSGKSGVGPTGTGYSDYSVTGSFTNNRYINRVFSTWATTSYTYTALTLNVSVAGSTSSNSNGGEYDMYYSTDTGSTWTPLIYVSGVGVNIAQATSTVTITGATLSNLMVVACAIGYADSEGNPDSAEITVFDIWTTGTYSTGNAKKKVYAFFM